MKVNDKEDENITPVVSRWFYNMEVRNRTLINIGIHQEDERIEGAVSRRPYIDCGVVIMQKVDDEYRLIEVSE